MSNGLKSALNDASQAMKDSDAAMKKGDWSAYGEAQKKLQEALNKALDSSSSFRTSSVRLLFA